ncbi:bifunctional lysylphosphatidylglycerol synthetase/lysine--tRNA ligase LysX [Microlunatus elymi]|uniref:Bifunctional lysylphosphatidylglycerol synthetase/lysine--tRNA ligase LysX n=1 Tax=Microlunatus elymi TaxID=2596828 RepID=A0A516PX19_9ACTN|nr:bifunctional lysylphosphatidylglycerol synthetase/lysine--tRNA ligase LysX [Microlunatus elymi]QDP95729.1 bifunctional lysylphosphatidylglycerol synthetase/lysine--tRNA ligase LysX [Microlunatus elymi]
MVRRGAGDVWPQRIARTLTTAYAVATLAAVGLMLFGRHGGAWFWRLGFGILNIPVDGSFLSVVALYLVTRALIGRKRVGLWLVGLFQLAAIWVGVATLLPVRLSPALALWRTQGPIGRTADILATGVTVAMLVLLWRIRGQFTGRLLPGSWRLAIAAAVIGTAVTGGVMWLLLGVQSTNRQRLDGVVDTVTAVLSGASHRSIRVTGVDPWVIDLTAFLAGVTLLVASSLFLISARPRNRWSPDREIALRELLAADGAEDSLGYFGTRRDRSAVFSPDGRAAVTYRVIAGVSLAAADPIGARDSWPAAIAAWLAEARRYGWQPAVLSAGETGARAYSAAGLRVLLMGDEAILDVARFTRRRPAMTAVRRAAGHARAAGVSVQIRRQSELDGSELEQLANASAGWLNGVNERGFTMALNRDADPADHRNLVVTAYTDGRLVAILRFVPWGWRDASLDLMRRGPDAPAGVTELMITELMARADRLGIARVSLNFCLFRGVYAEAERIGGRTLTKLNAGVLGVLDRFWQLERLYRANEKYRPSWVPRFLCYGDLLVLPRVLLAAAAAEGFLPWPQLRDRPPSRFPAGQLDRLLAITAPPVPSAPQRSDRQTVRRLDRLAELRSQGVDPYPAAEPAGTAATSLRELYETGAQPGRALSVSGRVRAIRDHGGVIFIDLIEGGYSLQLTAERGRTADFDRLGTIQSGDLLACTGLLGHTRNGTGSLLVRHWRLQAKSLHPLPWSHVDDPRSRSANRAADLITHPDDLIAIRQRAAAVGAIRDLLQRRDFLEVETPILQTVHGGAQARPFRTRLNGSGRELSLRIAPELYLKRLLVAGSGPVFEIGRNFRNEGIDGSHNPEFTSLEAYLPGGDYRTMMELARELIIAAAVAVHQKPVLWLPPAGNRCGDPAEVVDIGRPWPVVPMVDAVSAALGRVVGMDSDPALLRSLAERHQIAQLPADAGNGAVLEALYSKLVEPNTSQPTFYIDFPQETSPLTRPHRLDPGLVERWDLVAAGMEIGTAYTELTDPIDQRQRLTEQSLRAVAGDPEAMEVDEDFLRSLELGMPPTGGLGLGVDRVVMLLTNRPIRSVLAFPFSRSARSA